MPIKTSKNTAAVLSSITKELIEQMVGSPMGAETGREGNADRETAVRVTAGANGVVRTLDIATAVTENGHGSQFANCEPWPTRSTRQ